MVCWIVQWIIQTPIESGPCCRGGGCGRRLPRTPSTLVSLSTHDELPLEERPADVRVGVPGGGPVPQRLGTGEVHDALVVRLGLVPED